jgi:uracil-DNA glycosylase
MQSVRAAAHVLSARHLKKAAHREDVIGDGRCGFGDPRAAARDRLPCGARANRTGRVFTGMGRAVRRFLMRAMHAQGFSNIPSMHHQDDGLELRDAYITAAVRCAPPGNKPTLDEIAACHPHLVAEVAALPHVTVIVALGRIAFDATRRLLANRGIVIRPRPEFAHALAYATPVGSPSSLVPPEPSEHEHRKLTPAMLDEVFRKAECFLAF